MVRKSKPERDPIKAYFTQYPSFKYRPSADWRQLSAFHGLAKHCRWSEKRREKQFRLFTRTWTQAVETEFGGSSISHYQSLCSDLDISPIPDTVGECKTELREVFVNIVDLMQYRKDRQMGRKTRKPRKFTTLEQLSEYSHNSRPKKLYDKNEAKAEMLRELLKILSVNRE